MGVFPVENHQRLTLEYLPSQSLFYFIYQFWRKDWCIYSIKTESWSHFPLTFKQKVSPTECITQVRQSRFGAVLPFVSMSFMTQNICCVLSTASEFALWQHKPAFFSFKCGTDKILLKKKKISRACGRRSWLSICSAGKENTVTRFYRCSVHLINTVPWPRTTANWVILWGIKKIVLKSCAGTHHLSDNSNTMRRALAATFIQWTAFLLDVLCPQG